MRSPRPNQDMGAVSPPPGCLTSTQPRHRHILILNLMGVPAPSTVGSQRLVPPASNPESAAVRFRWRKQKAPFGGLSAGENASQVGRSEEHTSELQSPM